MRFHYRPSERADWMVCAIADRAGRIAALVARGLGERSGASGASSTSKLPMKRRTEALCHTRDEITAALDRSQKGPDARPGGEAGNN